MGTIEHQGKAPSTGGADERPHTTPKPGKSLHFFHVSLKLQLDVLEPQHIFFVFNQTNRPQP
jgi:hypothetical protein